MPQSTYPHYIEQDFEPIQVTDLQRGLEVLVNIPERTEIYTAGMVQQVVDDPDVDTITFYTIIPWGIEVGSRNNPTEDIEVTYINEVQRIVLSRKVNRSKKLLVRKRVGGYIPQPPALREDLDILNGDLEDERKIQKLIEQWDMVHWNIYASERGYQAIHQSDQR